MFGYGIVAALEFCLGMLVDYEIFNKPKKDNENN